MTQQEKADLDEMKAKLEKSKDSTFAYMKDVLRYTDNDLKAAGYTSIGQALEKTMKFFVAEEKKVIAAHIRKYPD